MQVNPNVNSKATKKLRKLENNEKEIEEKQKEKKR